MLKFSEFLTEDRIDFLKNQYAEKGINSSHDEFAQHRDSAAIIDHLSTHADPSKKKNYTQWLTDKYNKGQFRQEDHERLHASLSNFEKYKPKLEKKDINLYKTIHEVDDAVTPHLGTAVTNKEKVEEVKNTGINKVHEENGHQSIHIKTKEASQECYGGGSKRGGTGTDWCTAARSNSNMFDHYTRDGDKLYTFHIKDDEKSPYQMHMRGNGSIGQFADRHDHMIEDKSKIINKVPGLKGHPEFAGKHPLFDHPENISKEVEKYEKPNYASEVLKSGIKLPDHIYKPLAEKALKGAEASKDRGDHHHVITNLVNHPHTSTEALDVLANHSISNTTKSQNVWRIYGSNLGKHKNLSSESANKLLDSDYKNHAKKIAEHSPHPDVLARLASNSTNHEELAANPAAPKEVHEKILAGKNHLAHNDIFTNPNTDQGLLTQHAANPAHHAAISTNTNTHPDVLRDIFNKNKDHDWIHENLAKNSSTPKDVLKTLSTHSNKDISKAATKTLKVK